MHPDRPDFDVAGRRHGNTLKIKSASKLLAERRPDANLADTVRKLTGFQGPSQDLAITSKGVIERPSYQIERLVFESAPGRIVPALLYLPHKSEGHKRTILFANSRGKSADTADGGDLDRLASAGFPILAIDPAGIGETAASWAGYSDYWFGNAKIAWLALMVSRPLIGIRMEDMVRGIDVLEARGLAADGVTGFTKGSIGVAMLHAALIDPRLREISLEGLPTFVRDDAQTPLQRQIHDVILPDVLHHYDLPDLVSALGPGRVHMVNLKSPMWNAVPLRRRAASIAAIPILPAEEFEPVGSAYPEFR